MNKRGFTLVELLAVIILLAVMMLVAVPAVNKTIRDGKKNADKSNYDVVLNAAYDYVLKKNLTISDKEEIIIKVEELITTGYVKEDTKDGSGRLLKNDEVHVIKVKYGAENNSSNTENETVKYFGSYKFTYHVVS